MNQSGRGGPKQWGGVARRGAEQVRRSPRNQPHVTSRDDGPADDGTAEESRGRALRREADAAVGRGSANRSDGPPAKPRVPLPNRPPKREEVDAALVRRVGSARGAKLTSRVRSASRAYDEERFQDARSALAPVLKVARDIPEVRELNGLALYRLGRWQQAAEELEAFRELAGSTEQNPVLADAYRAQRRWADVDELWRELGAASPSAALVTEGRIVAAGALADRGQLDGAIRLLSKSWRLPKNHRPHHLRRAYALADLYERSGDLARARQLFGWVAGREPGFVDVDERLAALR